MKCRKCMRFDWFDIGLSHNEQERGIRRRLQGAECDRVVMMTMIVMNHIIQEVVHSYENRGRCNRQSKKRNTRAKLMEELEHKESAVPATAGGFFLRRCGLKYSALCLIQQFRSPVWATNVRCVTFTWLLLVRLPEWPTEQKRTNGRYQ